MSFASLWNTILDIVFPPVCIHCGAYIPKHAPHTLLCASCKESIIIRETLVCATCHARLPNNKPICHRNQNPQYLLGAASDYDNPALKTMIHALKYRRLPSAAPILADILSQYLLAINNNYYSTAHREALGVPMGMVSDSAIRQTAEAESDPSERERRLVSAAGAETQPILKERWNNYLLIPIPLHPTRERERGFNQTLLIAKELQKKFGIPIEKRLMRIKHTAPQVTRKNKEQRKENITHCFQIDNDNNKEKWKEKTILLIDDVTTSGETMKEAVRTLRAHGAKKIIALVVAKA